MGEGQGMEGRATNIGVIAVLGYIATVFAANWAINRFGVVSVGLGLVAPAGVYFAGLAFTLRDITQDTLGRSWVLVAILVGALLSALVSTQFALASATAFLFSELCDFAVYTPLRERNWIGAVAASNVVGLVTDSVLFLWIAFGSLEYLSGQIVGKIWMTLLAVGVLMVWRRYSGRPGWI
ncbi:MAG TPA: VUT family protein [Thermomicrobiales bacterium]|nr:VUT family protein [Thermomicrobiales bacterium]HQZ89486.1 VUT family protein [Thermomicrobiales bacterium]HRA31567.1 VUT family protein [Thermomicrobiales bacterium]